MHERRKKLVSCPPLPGVATRVGCSRGDRTRRWAPPRELPALPAPPGGRERRGGGGGVPQPRSCDSLEARAAGVSGVSGTITKRSQESASLPQQPPPPLQLETGPGERRQLRRGPLSRPRLASHPPGLRSRPLGSAACAPRPAPRPAAEPARAAAAETKLFAPSDCLQLSPRLPCERPENRETRAARS
ncbi:protein FAM246C-like [Ursus americanus]|uniref:protein FAM246C-like n=1 Tax=Ursus americanus TaxID=9643 RepID=UPI001E67A511|nr:protein FAM246C-like [Ursus americanus]